MSDEKSQEILIKFRLELPDAPSIVDFYIIETDEFLNFRKRLKKYKKKIDLGEINGKGYHMMYSPSILIKHFEMICDNKRIDAFKIAFPSLWVGNFGIIEYVNSILEE